MELANGRVVLALEGGYNLTSISESYLACMQAMLGDSPVLKVEHDLLPETFPVIKEVLRSVPYRCICKLPVNAVIRLQEF